MKKTFVIFVLALAAVMLAQPAPAQTSASQSTSPSSTNTKVIKDAAEYNAYMAALNRTTLSLSSSPPWLSQLFSSLYAVVSSRLLIAASIAANTMQPKS